LLDEVRSLWRELHGLAHQQFALAALEVKLAGVTLVRMVVAGVMVAILLLSPASGRSCARISPFGFAAVCTVMYRLPASRLAGCASESFVPVGTE
jgi:hypothetical protein